ncbi:MAG: LTA synthase family protein [Cellulosilyticum sp.]|nr:LTA synthase family protein [Cellulosilyticum sp.]
MLLIYFWIAIYYLETVFRIMSSGKIIGPGTFYSLIFGLPIAILCYLICSLFKESRRNTVGLGIIGIITILFMSQFIYFKIFRMFYSLYSATKAGQVFEFWEIIFMKVRNNFMTIVLMFIPFIALLLFKDKVKTIKLVQMKDRVYLSVGVVGIQLIGICTLLFAGRAIYTPYDLYFKHDYPVVAAEKLGLMTTLRLDVKRTLFDWTPSLSETSHEVTLIEDESANVVETFDEELEVDKNRTYNTMEIDFDKLIQEAESEEMVKMHTYFQNQTPSAKNAYTGKYKGYNLICITAEGFSPYVIREDLTPTLYKLSQEGYQFKNFYTPLWELSTSDGEYAICTSQIPSSGVWSMADTGDNKMPFTLGNQLKSQGYHTMAFHNHDFDYYERNISHPNLGYIYQAKGAGLEVTDLWPESDIEMMDLSVERYVDQEPFHTYYMTVSGHMNYSFRENDISEKNQALVENLDMSETAKAYLACQIELDRAVESLLSQLEVAGVLERTLIMITPDHYPYGLNNEYISELAGKTVDEDFELYRSTMLLYTPNMEPVVVDKPCSSLDVLPTLSNLMGLEYDSRLFVGRDIFSDSDPLVILYSHNFITDKGRYNALTNEFMAVPGAKVDEAYVKEMMNQVEEKFYYSSKVLEEDYYSYILSVQKH